MPSPSVIKWFLSFLSYLKFSFNQFECVTILLATNTNPLYWRLCNIRVLFKESADKSMLNILLNGPRTFIGIKRLFYRRSRSCAQLEQNTITACRTSAQQFAKMFQNQIRQRRKMLGPQRLKLDLLIYEIQHLTRQARP